MHTYCDTLDAARAILADKGGWLLDVGGRYLVTDDEGTVRDMRGAAFLEACEARQVWDETAE